MCKKEYINLQTKEVLDLEKVSTLPDNAMLKVKPELWVEWDFEKNNELGIDIFKMKKSSKYKPFWKCEKGHEWNSVIYSRTIGVGCPYCSRRKIRRGETDMWTTNPTLANLLLYPEDGYNYRQCSNKPVDWKCEDCGEIIRNKQINQIKNHGLSCPKCSDGFKYPEKFMHNFLSQLNINFEFQKKFDWSQNKVYDFYIPSINMIIEVHGKQHSGDGGFERVGGRTVEEEQKNDKLKYSLAISNGIKHYIVIDARRSELDWIRISILSSKLNGLYNLSEIDWENIHKKSLKSLVKDVCDLWNNGVKCTNEISVEMKMHRGTIIKYLKQGSKIGWCDYCPKEAMSAKRGVTCRKTVVQLKLDGSFLKEWCGISYVQKALNISHITCCCIGKRKSAGGFKWMYKEDYDKYIEEQNGKLA